MAFTAQDVMKLREMTGIGMMECKKALTESNGDIDKAVEWLEKNNKKVEKVATRIAAEGAVFSYIHMGGKIGVLLEVNCETDFAAKSEGFLALGKDIAMHIAASKPTYVRSSEIPETIIEKQKAKFMEKMDAKKPAAIQEKIVAGQIEKYFEEICLENQKFVKDDSKTVLAVVNDSVKTIGEKITIRRFVRFEMGEGLEKKVENFAEEVAKQSK